MLALSWSFKSLGLYALGRRVECSANTLDHKEGEISRLMDEIHQLKDSVDSQRLVLEAASTLSRYGDEFGCTKRRSTSWSSQVWCSTSSGFFSAIAEALQDLSTRMSAVEDAQEVHADQVQSHNSAAVSFPFPPSGLPPRPRSFPALAGSGGQGFHQMMAEMVLTMKMKN